MDLGGYKKYAKSTPADTRRSTEGTKSTTTTVTEATKSTMITGNLGGCSHLRSLSILNAKKRHFIGSVIMVLIKFWRN